MRLDDCTVLVVEDEPLIGIMIQDMLADLGCPPASMVGSHEAALEALEAGSPTLALLNVNLGAGADSFGIAAACRARGIPVVFTTAYAGSDVPAECGDAPVLAKPFSPDEMARAMRSALGLPGLAPQLRG